MAASKDTKQGFWKTCTPRNQGHILVWYLPQLSSKLPLVLFWAGYWWINERCYSWMRTFLFWIVVFRRIFKLLNWKDSFEKFKKARWFEFTSPFIVYDRERAHGTIHFSRSYLLWVFSRARTKNRCISSEKKMELTLSSWRILTTYTLSDKNRVSY